MAFSLALGVTPESLKDKSTQVSSDIDEMNTEIQILISEIQETSPYWLGDAGTAVLYKKDGGQKHTTILKASGSDYRSIIIPAGGFRDKNAFA